MMISNYKNGQMEITVVEWKDLHVHPCLLIEVREAGKRVRKDIKGYELIDLVYMAKKITKERGQTLSFENYAEAYYLINKKVKR